MRKRDKLDRLRNDLTARLTARNGVPFWITLTPRERTQWPAHEVQAFYLRQRQARRAFRDFIRSLCQEGR